MKALNSLIIITIIVGSLSCKKTEGPGGTSSIIGKVWAQDYTSDFSFLKAEFWAEEEDVYIIYGNDSIYSDRTKTNFDGSYWFQFLNEGNYTIYAYSRDSSRMDYSPSGRIPVKVRVNIDKSGTDVVAPQITILN